MCQQRGGLLEQIDTAHTEAIKRYLTYSVLPAIQAVAQRSAADPRKLLEEIKFRWDNHKTMNKWYAKFLRLNHSTMYHVKYQGEEAPSLADKSLNIFKTHVYEHIKVGTMDAILGLIEKERDGEIVNKKMIKCVVGLYVKMGMGELDVYESDFVSFFFMFLPSSL